MKTFLLFLIGAAWVTPARAEALTRHQTIPLPGVSGRIDHLCIDASRGRLFVAALGNNTVEVVDLKAGNIARSLPGFSEPQGVLYVDELDRLYVANGGDGTLRVLDGTTLEPIASLKLDGDADNVRYDVTAKRIYVGYGGGALAVVDPAKNVLVGAIPLSSHPESFQLEQSGPRIFVNLPGSHTVAVADRTTGRVTARWALGFAAANFPLALDEANHRAFVACRAPARLLVFDVATGREVAKLELHGDCDDVFYDPARGQVYASCGEGFVDVFTQADPDHYRLREAVRTEAKARTCLFDGAKLYLAVPAQSGRPAKLEVLACGPSGAEPARAAVPRD